MVAPRPTRGLLAQPAPGGGGGLLDMLYPQGYGGGLLGMGSFAGEVARNTAGSNSRAANAMAENYQRGREDPAYAAIGARLAESPYENPMAGAFGGPAVIGKIAYHGTPATFAPTATNKFGQFLSSFINKGEGNQAYGQGTYLAEAKDVAQRYAGQLSKDGKGTVYQAEIPDTGFLKWDAPIADSPEVAKALGLQGEALQMSGQQVYESMWKSLWKDHIKQTGNKPDPSFDPRKAASDQLRQLGVNGIEYLDSASRGMGSGTSNYVLFDPASAKITGRE